VLLGTKQKNDLVDGERGQGGARVVSERVCEREREKKGRISNPS
jgi:hypothetical protein